jgi:uncharacterized protein with von Willebrand factor type A (vWA) domain
MKFSIVEDVKDDIKTVETQSNLSVEFHIYSPDRSNPQADQFVAQLEQRLAAFGTENAEQTNESGKPFSMYRLVGKKFQNPQQISEFFQKEFPDFIKLLDQIWRMSNNFVRVILVEDSNPPKQIPGRIYTLLAASDYQNMLTSLRG